MEKDEGILGSEVSRDRGAERDQCPAPGKVTRTSKLTPRPGQAAQRKAPAATPGSRPLQARPAWEHTMDSWMDAAHRGCSATLPVQRKEGAARDGAAPSAMSGGGGQSLPGPVQAKMEQAFDTDFSAVRVHQGPHAEALGALAYTQGNAVHFGPGQYDPGSQRGQELLGHELAHVVQQREGRVASTRQAKGVALNDDQGLEREADVLGQKAARGEQARTGPGAPGQVSSDVVQRAAMPTHFGTFDTAEYEPIRSTATGQEIGVEILLEFTPGQNVDATAIGLTQALRPTREGNPDPAGPAAERRTVASGAGAGHYVDQLPGSPNPIYATGANQRAGGSAQDLAVYETVPTRALNAREQAEVAAQTGVSGKSHTGWGQNGHRYMKDGVLVGPRNATLYDAPKRPVANDSGQVFETTALAIDGAQEGTYYGSVQWGWQRDGSGNFSMLPLSLVSRGVPSVNFLSAAAVWNGATEDVGLETSADPTHVLADNLRVSFTVPRGTRLQSNGTGQASGNTYHSVTIQDGTNRTGWVLASDTTQMDVGRATVNLPLVDVHTVSNPAGVSLNEGVPGPWRHFNTLPRSTRVRITDHSHVMGPHLPDDKLAGKAWIEVVDGPLTGAVGWVTHADLAPETRGTRP